MLVLKKTMAIAAACASLIVMTGCGNTDSSQSQDTQPAENTPISSSNDGITIEQLPYTIKTSVSGGDRELIMNLTNNTDFNLTQIQLQYNLKPDVTDDQIKEAFSDDVKISELKTNGLLCNTNNFTQKEKSTQATCSYGSGPFTNEEQLALVEPNSLAVEYINPDTNTLQTVYYDYTTNEMIDDVQNQSMDVWPVGSPRAALIPQPTSTWITNLIDDEGIGLSFSVLGATQNDYQQYLSECMDMGWQTESSWGSNSSFGEKDGYTLTVYYYPSSTMYVSLDLAN